MPCKPSYTWWMAEIVRPLGYLGLDLVSRLFAFSEGWVGRAYSLPAAPGVGSYRMLAPPDASSAWIMRGCYRIGSASDRGATPAIVSAA